MKDDDDGKLTPAFAYYSPLSRASGQSRSAKEVTNHEDFCVRANDKSPAPDVTYEKQTTECRTERRRGSTAAAEVSPFFLIWIAQRWKQRAAARDERRRAMSARVGSKEFLDARGIRAWAGVPREVILRAMAPDQCLDSRLRHAMILWSWCGPEPTEAVVQKDSNGVVLRDASGRPKPARLKDLVAVIGLAAGMKGHVTRVVQGMIRQDLLRAEAKILYLVFKPAAFDPKNLPVAVHGNWTIAGVAVHGNHLPADPVARALAIRFLEDVHARWKAKRNDANAWARELLRTGGSERGILIEKNRKSSREEKGAAASTVRAEEAHQARQRTTTTHSEPKPGTGSNRIEPDPAEVELVTAELARFGEREPAAAERLIAACRENAPGVPIEVILEKIAAKAPRTRHARNPVGLLLTAVPALFVNWRPEATPPKPPKPAEADPTKCALCNGGSEWRGETCPECNGTGESAATQKAPA